MYILTLVVTSLLAVHNAILLQHIARIFYMHYHIDMITHVTAFGETVGGMHQHEANSRILLLLSISEKVAKCRRKNLRLRKVITIREYGSP